MKFYEVPSWLKKGYFYKSRFEDNEYDKGTDIGLDEETINKYVRDNSKIENIDDFIVVYEISNFWQLKKYPLDIYVHGFLYEKNCIDFLEQYDTKESEILKNDIKDKISFINYLPIINEKFTNEKIQSFFKRGPLEIINNDKNIKNNFKIFSDFLEIYENFVSLENDEECQTQFVKILKKKLNKNDLGFANEFMSYKKSIICSFYFPGNSYLMLPIMMEGKSKDFYKKYLILLNYNITKVTNFWNGTISQSLNIQIAKISKKDFQTSERMYGIYSDTQNENFSKKGVYKKNVLGERKIIEKEEFLYNFYNNTYKNDFNAQMKSSSENVLIF